MKKKTDPPPVTGTGKPAQARRNKKNTAVTRAIEADIQRFIHELETHQIELGMQNEELAQVRAEVEAALRQYTDLYDFAPVGYFTLGDDGAILQANLAGANLLGVEHDELARRRLGVFVSIESRPAYNVFFEKLLSGEGKETCDLAFIKKGDEPLWARLEATCFEGGQECRAVMMDISERVKAETALRESEARLRNVVDESPFPILIHTDDGKVLTVNQVWTDLSGYTLADIPTLEAWFEKAFNMRQQFAHREMYRLYNPKQRQTGGEYNITCQDGSQRVWSFSSVSLNRTSDDRQMIVTMATDITERRRAEEALEAANLTLQTAFAREQQLARTDPLTGVRNRRYLYELAEHEFEVAARYKQPLSVILFDIDHFKKVNDTFGHIAGDLMLQSVTQVTRAELRSADVIGRYGGEEFIILLPMTNAQQAYLLAERIRMEVAALRVPTPKGDASVTISIGIVEMTETSPTELVEDVFRRADEAMYAAKQAGRNRTEIGTR